jgi:hypothetical protein
LVHSHGGGLALGEKRGGGVSLDEVVRVDVGDGPVQGLGPARGRPDEGGGLQSIGLGQLVDRRGADDLVGVEQRVGDELDGVAGGAVEIPVGDDAVAGGVDASDERGVVGPGDGGERAAHAAGGAGAFGGELADRRHLGGGVVEVVVGQTVDADEHDDTVGGGGWGGGGPEREEDRQEG